MARKKARLADADSSAASKQTARRKYPPGAEGHDAAILLVEFVRRLRADHGQEWKPTREDFELALRLLRLEDWTWEWAWLAAIGLVERTESEGFAAMGHDTIAFAQTGRARFAELAAPLVRFGNGPPLSNDLRVDPGLLMNASFVERYGVNSLAQSQKWFPPEWSSILWLRVKLTSHSPEPSAPCVGEDRSPTTQTQDAAFNGATSIFLSKLPARLMLDLGLPKTPSRRTITDLIKAVALKPRGSKGAEHWLEEDDYARLLEFCRTSGRPRPNAGRPANIKESR